jgi:hypothetical protein
MIADIEIIECATEDLPALRAFIDQHWRKGHILACDQAVLDWYYGTGLGANFLLAKSDGEIFAVLGYIDSDRFYRQPPAQSELWLALWKVRDDTAVPGLGVRLILELKKRYPQRPFAVLGLSEAAKKIFTLLRYQVRTLDQLFIYNRQLNRYRLLRGCLPIYCCQTFLGDVNLVDDVAQLRDDAGQISDCRQRGVDYFIHRYLRNPFNCYQLFRIELNDTLCYAIGRVMSANGGSALRLVDIYGQLPLLGQALGWFEQYLQCQGLEYMDFYLCSEQSAQLQTSGFINRAACAGDVIIPNYFEPFVAHNVDLQCAMENGFTGPIFKADGDQERPNQVSSWPASL